MLSIRKRLVPPSLGYATHSRDYRPMPFVRLDGLFLLLAWLIPFLPVSGNTLNDALSMAALFMPMSYAWAAGDVSLNAFIQSNLINIESKKPGVSTLASIMSFLYVTYVSTTLCAPSHVHNYFPSRLPRTLFSAHCSASLSIRCLGGMTHAVLIFAPIQELRSSMSVGWVNLLQRALSHTHKLSI